MMIALFLANSALADLSKLEFLKGTWTGPAFGGTATESWQAPEAKTMLGSFKTVMGNGNTVIELFIVEDTAEGVVMRWNHYNKDYSRWEDSTNEHWLIESGHHAATFALKKEVAGLPRNIVYKRKGDELFIWVGDLEASDKSGAFEFALTKSVD